MMAEEGTFALKFGLIELQRCEERAERAWSMG
jgi:hypothetical protein